MELARVDHTATRLHDGRVLICGGLNQAAQTATAELYDSKTQTSSLLSEEMNVARSLHSATRLRDGRVLIAGGLAFGQSPAGMPTAEIFTP
jgi:hypothetical protein